MPCSMLDDQREVLAIFDNDGEWKVGRIGITKIIIYPEPAHMGIVPWAAIYEGEKITTRMDMAGKGVVYKQEVELWDWIL